MKVISNAFVLSMGILAFVAPGQLMAGPLAPNAAATLFAARSNSGLVYTVGFNPADPTSKFATPTHIAQVNDPDGLAIGLGSGPGGPPTSFWSFVRAAVKVVSVGLGFSESTTLEVEVCNVETTYNQCDASGNYTKTTSTEVEVSNAANTSIPPGGSEPCNTQDITAFGELIVTPDGESPVDLGSSFINAIAADPSASQHTLVDGAEFVAAGPGLLYGAAVTDDLNTPTPSAEVAVGYIDGDASSSTTDDRVLVVIAQGNASNLTLSNLAQVRLPNMQQYEPGDVLSSKSVELLSVADVNCVPEPTVGLGLYAGIALLVRLQRRRYRHSNP